MISRFERFSFVITEISRYWHKIAAEEMEKHGLKGPHALYLVTMRRYPEGITATQLAELCSKDKSDVSRSMSLMIKKGLVRKEGEKNRYRALLKLTDEGHEAASQVEKSAMVAVDAAGRGITDENREIFYDSLDKIADNLQAIIDEGLFSEQEKQGNTKENADE